MKKVFLTLVAIATMGVANAQLFVGGNVGISSTSGTNEVTAAGITNTTYKPKTIGWEITPKIGFQMDKLAIGAIFGVNGEKRVNKIDADNSTTISYFGWEVAPFVRYNAFEFGNFALFAELQLGINGGKDKGKIVTAGATTEADGAKYFGLGVQVVPGLSYNLSDHLSFDMYVNLLRLGWYMDKATDTPDPTDATSKDVDKDTGFIVGVYSLPSAFTIGFNYKF